MKVSLKKMFKYIKMNKAKVLVVSVLMLVIASCTKKFEELNTNKNAPTENNPATLLPSVIFEPINDLINLEGWLTNQIMQYYVRRNDNQLDAYDFATGSGFFNAVWLKNYSAISNANDMITASKANGLSAYEAAAKTMKAFYMATNTELWIDAPGAEAGLGIGNTNPAYDKQQTIYTNVLKELKEANTMFATSTGFTAGGDVLFKGDVMKWRKLANSLRLRYLLRLSNRAEVNAPAEINAIVSDPATYPIINSNSEAGIYDFSGTSPNISSFAVQPITVFSGLSMSKRIQLVYESYDDPRVDFFFRKPTNTAQFPNHEGVPNGIPREQAQSWNGNGDANTSLLTTRFVNNGLLDYTIISYAEVKFILAEAAMKNWITTGPSAKQHYDAAITANFAQWGIDMPAGFLALPAVVWNNSMARLMDQKWMAFFFNNTIEAWGEYKRTGLPNLTPGALASTVTGGKVPTRIFYPTLEQSINSANYKAASASIGGDIITAKHWYQN
jgi:hypothetical protein